MSTLSSYSDRILLQPSDPPEHLIYFIPGNPGLSAFYEPFLRYLHSFLQARYPSHPTAVAGRCLAGFELDEASVTGKLYGLDDQVAYVADSIARVVDDIVPKHMSKPLPVTIIGHSLGGYLALRTVQNAIALKDSPPATPLRYEVVAAMPLFPAVANLHESRNAQLVNWVPSVPGGGLIARLLLNSLVWALWPSLLQSVIARKMGCGDAPEGSEQAEAVKITTAYLKSKTGLSQSVHVGMEELLYIREDRWGDALWGAEASVMAPKLFFYFGANDSWIAKKTTDKLIAARAYVAQEGMSEEERWKVDRRPLMEVDQGGVPHSFCIGHSETVAKKVAAFMAQAY